ncbi:MAG: hypothetical protein HQM11_03485 [SAR324 cluster bacterium]|nr:hypothetical protein [SAR324 cluster bacterium]
MKTSTRIGLGFTLFFLILNQQAFSQSDEDLFQSDNSFGISSEASPEATKTESSANEFDAIDSSPDFTDFGTSDSANDLSGGFKAQSSAPRFELAGMLEIERGGRVDVDEDRDQDWTLDNIRVRVKSNGSSQSARYYLKLDFVQDSVIRETHVDIREARILFTPLNWMDISVGKQVSTWGVGDMLFINDLFPKNWVANFAGQEMEYLKDGSNSIRMTSYFGMSGGVDIVFHPQFAPDTTPDGCRFSIYNPNSMLDPTQPELMASAEYCDLDSTTGKNKMTDSELATRWFFKVSDFEVSFYTYSGFYKNPKGLQWLDAEGKASGNSDPFQTHGYTALTSDYPGLNVLGFSLEGQLGNGILSWESGFYQSKDDLDGEELFIENSSVKNLIGYRLDLSASVFIGFQWYAELMQNYDSYEESILALYQTQYQAIMAAQGQTVSAQEAMDWAREQELFKYRREEIQNTYTLRLTLKFMQETLFLNTFVYERPEDHDRFVKLDIKKQMDNALSFALGVNLFEGDDHYLSREFAMLKQDDNAFVRMNYQF